MATRTREELEAELEELTERLGRLEARKSNDRADAHGPFELPEPIARTRQ